RGGGRGRGAQRGRLGRALRPRAAVPVRGGRGTGRVAADERRRRGSRQRQSGRKKAQETQKKAEDEDRRLSSRNLWSCPLFVPLVPFCGDSSSLILSSSAFICGSSLSWAPHEPSRLPRTPLPRRGRVLAARVARRPVL